MKFYFEGCDRETVRVFSGDSGEGNSFNNDSDGEFSRGTKAPDGLYIRQDDGSYKKAKLTYSLF